jgi:hypothetical protein
MVDEITSIISENNIPNTNEDENNNISRRDFGKLAAATAIGVASIATEAAIVQNTDSTFRNHVSSLIDDTSRIISTDPEYASNREYLNLYIDHSEFIEASEGEFTKVIAPGLDKFFNLYFGKSISEGLQILEPIANEMGINKRNLLVAGAFWGEEKIRTENRVLLEDATNVAQTVISAELDSKLKPVQGIYRSSAFDNISPQYLRQVGSKRLRSIGPNDSDARSYARSVSMVTAREKLPTNYFGTRLYNGSQEVAKLSVKLDNERKSKNVSEKTSGDFVQAARVLENQILNSQKDLEFGLKLFTASIRYREYIIQKNLGLNNFEDLNEEQRNVVELILLTSMDDYPHKTEFEYDEKLDGQFSYPEGIVPAIVQDIKNKEFVDIDTMLDPSIWNVAIQSKVEFLQKLDANK